MFPKHQFVELWGKCRILLYLCGIYFENLSESCIDDLPAMQIADYQALADSRQFLRKIFPLCLVLPNIEKADCQLMVGPGAPQ